MFLSNWFLKSTVTNLNLSRVDGVKKILR